jgi:uncharacterized protein YqgC (DUF456 family)
LVACLLFIISVDILTNYSDWCKIVWFAKNCGASKEEVREVSKKQVITAMMGLRMYGMVIIRLIH